MDNYLILGGSGHARETCLHILDAKPNSNIIFFDEFAIADTLQIKDKNYSVLKALDPELKDKYRFIVGVGLPEVKIKLIQKAEQAGFKPADTVIHPSAVVQNAKIGLGGLIAPGVVVTTDVTIGDYVVLNYNCTVGHDSTIGDLSTCNPCSCVSGNVKIEDSVLLGVGAAVKEGISISSQSIIGGKAFVNKNIEEKSKTWVGVPAVELKK